MSGRRTPLRGHGVPEHPQPFPPAIRIGDMVFSSAIGGADPITGALPDDVGAQARNAFAHIRTILALAGGDVGDIAKANIYLTDRAHRDAVNPHWIDMFPEDDDRPVRHTSVGPLPGGMLIQVEIIAVLAAR